MKKQMLAMGLFHLAVLCSSAVAEQCETTSRRVGSGMTPHSFTGGTSPLH
jgi:hypothetical protein